jgi:hypothetical protein
MKIYFNRIIVCLCLSLCLCLKLSISTIQAAEVAVDWLPIDEVTLLSSDFTQAGKLSNAFVDSIKGKSEILVDWYGQDFLTIELQQPTTSHSSIQSNDSSIVGSQLPLLLFASKGDGVFVEVQAEKTNNKVHKSIRWILSNPSKQFSQVLMYNTSSTELVIKLFKGKKRKPFDWFQFAKVYRSNQFPRVSITSDFDSSNDYNHLVQAEFAETLKGPELYRFEVIYPWYQDYGVNQLSQINVTVGNAEIDARFIKIQPSRYTKSRINGVANVLSRKQYIDVWVPEGQHIIRLSADRPLYLRWLVANSERQLLLNTDEYTSDVSNKLNYAASKNYDAQRDFNQLIQQQIGYRSIFPEQAITTLDTPLPSVNTSKQHSKQYFVEQNINLKAQYQYQQQPMSSDDSDLEAQSTYFKQRNTRFVNQQALSKLHYKNPSNSTVVPLRLKLKVTNVRQEFNLETSAKESLRLLFDPRLIADTHFFTEYQRSDENINKAKSGQYVYYLEELVRTLEIKFKQPWNDLILTNLSQKPLIHQLSYAFVKPVETSETEFDHHLKQWLMVEAINVESLDRLLFELLSNSVEKVSNHSKFQLTQAFKLELENWASRLANRVATFSESYKIEKFPISEKSSQNAFAKVVSAVTELGVELSHSQTKNIDHVFKLFTQSLLNNGNYSLLKKTLYYFTQSHNVELQRVSEKHLLNVFYHLQNWRELESYWAIRLKSLDRRGFSGIAASWLKQGRNKQAGRLFLLSGLLSKQFYSEGLVALAESKQSKLFEFALQYFEQSQRSEHYQLLNKSNKHLNCKIEHNNKTDLSRRAELNHLHTTCQIELSSNIDYFETITPALFSQNKISLLYNQPLDLYFKSIKLTEQNPIMQKIIGPALIKLNFFEYTEHKNKTFTPQLTFKLGDKSIAYELLDKDKMSNLIVAANKNKSLLVNQSFLLSIPAGEQLLTTQIKGASGEVTVSRLVDVSGLTIEGLKSDQIELVSQVRVRAENNQAHIIKSSDAYLIKEQDSGLKKFDGNGGSRFEASQSRPTFKVMNNYFGQNYGLSLKPKSKNRAVPSHHVIQFETASNTYSKNKNKSKSESESESEIFAGGKQISAKSDIESQEHNRVNSHTDELSLFNQISLFTDNEASEEHLALANELKLYLTAAAPSIELLSSIKQFLQNFEWRLVDSVISSAGRISVEQQRLAGKSLYSKVRNTLLSTNLKQYELPLYQQNQRVIQYYSQSALTAKLVVRALNTLGSADSQVIINTSINDIIKSHVFNSQSELTLSVKLNAGLNIIKLNIKQSSNQLFYFSFFKREPNGLIKSLIKEPSSRYYAASQAEPLKIFMQEPGWLKVEMMVGNKQKLYEKYVAQKGVVTFKSVNQGVTKYRVSQLIQSKPNQGAPDRAQSLFNGYNSFANSDLEKNISWGGRGETLLSRYDNFSLNLLDSGTHSLSIGYHLNSVLEDEPLVKSGNEQKIEYRYRRYLPELSSYLSNRVWYKQANQFDTLSNRFHFDYLSNKNVNFEFDLNTFYQLYSQDSDSQGAFRLSSSARANWSYFWNNQLRNKLSGKIELGYMNYPDSVEQDISAIDADVYTSYKKDHLNKFVLNDRLIFRPYFDTQLSFTTSLSSNEISQEFSLDNYDLSFGVRQFWNKYRLDARFLHKYYFKDINRVTSFESNRLRLKFDYDLWSNHSNLWQFSLAYQYEFQQSESEIQLWFSWTPTNKQYLQDFSAIDEPFLKLRDHFIGQQRLNNTVVEDSHEE